MKVLFDVFHRFSNAAAANSVVSTQSTVNPVLLRWSPPEGIPEKAIPSGKKHRRYIAAKLV
jgi:hypothetical protein